MASALRYLFESELTNRIVKFFRTRGERARIIAPSWVHTKVVQNMPADHPPLRAIWSERLSAPDADSETLNYIIVADDAEQEKDLLAGFGQGPRANSYGLFRDVVPALLCGPNGLARGHGRREVKRYALLCVPRSGSRYLAATLNNKGLGAAQEHLREPLAAIITDGKLGYSAAFASLERFGQHNGIFGTKLISSFLFKASRGSLAVLESNIQWMVARGYRIVHLRRALEETVISSYIASRLEKWHFFGEMDEATRSKLDEMGFDERAAMNEYVRFRAQRAALDHLTAKFDLPVFDYADVRADVESVASTICGFLGADPDSLQPGSASVPVATRTESTTYNSFAQSLEQLLERRAQEIVPRTIRQLQSMLRVDEETAERIANPGPVSCDRPATS